MSRRSELCADPPKRVRDTLELWGIRLCLSRRRWGLRQQDVADAIGVSRYTVAAVERGKPSTSVAVYLAAANELGITLKGDDA